MVAEMVEMEQEENGRARLRPFVFAERWRWLQAPAVSEGVDIEGFEAEVRVSLSNADLQAFKTRLMDIDTRRVELNTTFSNLLGDLVEERTSLMAGAKEGKPHYSPEERDKRLEKNRMAVQEAREKKDEKERVLMLERFELAAPHIRQWNACVPSDNALGYEEIPPPIDGGAASLEAINPQMAAWVTNSICDAWRLGKSLTGKLPPSVDTLALSQAPKGGPRVVSE